MVCIYCKGETVKYGVYSETKQRFKCLQCKKTFGEGTIANGMMGDKKRLTLHLILAGCNKVEICTELEIEERIVDKWQKKYLRALNEIVPSKPLLAVKTLLTIYKAIEKSRISKINTKKGFRRFRRL